MGAQGYDFDERLSQNEIHEVGRLAPSIVNRDSRPADQFYTIDPEREPVQFDRVETLSAEHVSRRLDLQSSKAAEKKVIIVGSRDFPAGMYPEKHSIGAVDTRGDVVFIFGVG